MSVNNRDVTNGEIMFVLAKVGIELSNLTEIVSTLWGRVSSETEDYAKFPSKEIIAKNYSDLFNGLSDDDEAESDDASISVETKSGSKGFKIVCGEDDLDFIKKAIIKAIKEQGYKEGNMDGKKKC
jgi:hypothetical protein